MEWKKPSGQKYGLQVKIVAPAAKKRQLKKPLPFSSDDNIHDDYNVEDDIARQATKKQSAREVELQHKQALEEDAHAFDYDGVYDEMKGKQSQPIREDRAKREPKYIGKLLEQAKVRAVEHDIAFERSLAKERMKEDHLFPDKEKFVTNAYKKKLMEQGKWLEKERQQELLEQAQEVSKKGDMSDFYRNLLNKNVAFGAKEEKRLPEAGHVGSEGEEADKGTPKERNLSDDQIEESKSAFLRTNRNIDNDDDLETNLLVDSIQLKHQVVNEVDLPTVSSTHISEKVATNISGAPAVDDHVSKIDPVKAARERYLARKKQRTGQL